MSRSPLQANIIDVGDVLVIGAGLAGLFTALKLGARPVTVMAAGKRNKGAASKWAQGGIAAALGPDDNPALHAQDTIDVGSGLVDEMSPLLSPPKPKAALPIWKILASLLTAMIMAI